MVGVRAAGVRITGQWASRLGFAVRKKKNGQLGVVSDLLVRVLLFSPFFFFFKKKTIGSESC
jgi:hypothetical protein